MSLASVTDDKKFLSKALSTVSGVYITPESTSRQFDITSLHSQTLQWVGKDGVSPMRGYSYGFDRSIFDKPLNYDFTNVDDADDDEYERGGKPYKRPCGWYRIAIIVNGKYPDSKWLGGYGTGGRYGSVDGEWPVSYHGTNWSAAQGIAGEVNKNTTMHMKLSSDVGLVNF